MDKEISSKSCRVVSRRDFMKMSSGAVLAAVSGCHRGYNYRLREHRPNLLMIITDEQHIDTIRAGGCRYVSTPAMDRLVRQGIHFQMSYSCCPTCAPSRSSMFTGRMPSETGVYKGGRPIRSGISNLGEWLSQNTDYETVYTGKWHVPYVHQKHIEGFRVLTTGVGGHGILGDTSTSRACEGFLRNRSKNSPFFMVASFLQPHDINEWIRFNTYNSEQVDFSELIDRLPPLPCNFHYDPHEPDIIKNLVRKSRSPVIGEWSERHWRYYLWSYYRQVEMVDGEIGRLLNTLHESGYDKETLVLLTSDHREGLAHHSLVQKGVPYDESMKVPLIFSWPGNVLENKTDFSHLVSGLDIIPTLCDYARIDPPEKMRGMSLRPLLEGGALSRRMYIVAEMPNNWGRMLRTEQYKYVSYGGDPVEMLFDMSVDPWETRNLASLSEYAGTLEDLRKQLVDWERQLDVAPDMPNRDSWWYG